MSNMTLMNYDVGEVAIMSKIVQSIAYHEYIGDQESNVINIESSHVQSAHWPFFCLQAHIITGKAAIQR
jgi:hypothetical protein